MTYLNVPTAPAPYTSSDDYQKYGVKIPGELFLNNLNVPTRPFTSGFANDNGTPIRLPDGKTLIEYFSFQVASKIRLVNDQPAGDYQFAILSDDGAHLDIQVQGQADFIRLIDNEGDHPTKMKCATRPVHILSSSDLPIRVGYYQGPKIHISMILMWRPYPTHSSDVLDPECDQSGNDRFFDSTKTPSAPQQAYKDLLSRGWKPLNPENYLLKEGYNACSKP